MAKPILYYALVKGHGYMRGFNVLAVTLEKGGSRGQVYGRDEYDNPTHVAAYSVIYRFPEGTPLDFCKDAGKRADAEARKHEVGLEQARAELSRLQDVKTAAVLNAAKGVYTTAGDPKMIRQPDGSAGYLCTACDRGTLRDFCPKCGASAP